MVLFGVRSEVPKEFGKLKQLEYLYLNNDFIKIFPVALFELENIKTLQISMNGIDSIPEGLSRLQDLEEIHFYCSNLKKLPNDIWKIRGLKKVILSVDEKDFDFSSAFTLISKSPSIVEIDFSYTYLEKLPSLSVLQNIKTLKFHTYIDNLDELNKRLTEIAQIENLEVLHIDLPYSFKKNSRVMPDSIQLIRNLKTLIIEGQCIDTVPHWVSKMEKLELINVKDCSFNEAIDRDTINEGKFKIKFGTIGESLNFKKVNKPFLKEMQVNDTIEFNYDNGEIYLFSNSYHSYLVKKQGGYELLIKLIEEYDFNQTGWVKFSLTSEELQKIEKIDRSSKFYKEKMNWENRMDRESSLTFRSSGKEKIITGDMNMRAFLAIYKKYERKAYPVE